MKYAQILLATTLTAAAATSFAATETTNANTNTEEKVIVSTQELPESNAPVAGANAEQPAASEAAAESATPAQPAAR
ncbi:MULTISPECIES: hypothetical protein [Acinetobacter]|uniref:Uncharacterized protein n=1 Tax=Acinetobacter pseudolwoffii TaxID=2053287 RepID=N9KTK1_9GAMM|nr:MULTISPECIES: hypothetical protein [Acinetobacter]ENW23871.1 hypothetical protein F925_02839 [Acinetobacter lwoffii NCTC 5866 = CIP 64.10 = NIPH 512]ENW87348.1 hypothetical protein F906_00581 [Acinetobacter pseudolwoffii]MCO8090633.1 hypothetical protein [Acinetobacter pseudolwoffii]MCP0912184.1 hypothetical protein [Acinetobacter pseudolwoffii]MDH5819832.1 hypothetical protein [Acinetobacter pseudolwoffii]